MIKVDEATLSIQDEFIVDLKRIKLNFIQVIIKRNDFFSIITILDKIISFTIFFILSCRLVAE